MKRITLHVGLLFEGAFEMHSAAQAYAQTATANLSPRDAEAAALLKSANQLQTAKDHWDQDQGDVANALYFNRQLWILLSSSVADQNNPLPVEIRNNVANLGTFVFKHTLDIEARPEADKLDQLININRELAAGLQGNV
jgi:flagellar protein FlaF